MGWTVFLNRTWAIVISFMASLAEHGTRFLFSDTRWRGWRNKQLIIAVQMLWKLLQRISQRSWWTCSVAMAIYTPLWLNIDSLIHSNMQEDRGRETGGGNFFLATSRSNNLSRKSVKDHREKLILSSTVRFEQEPKSKAWTSVEEQPLALMQEMQGETCLHNSIVNTEYPDKMGPAKPVYVASSLNRYMCFGWSPIMYN